MKLLVSQIIINFYLAHRKTKEWVFVAILGKLKYIWVYKQLIHDPADGFAMSILQLLQFRQSDLIGFKVHILNFRNGSVIVNKKMKLSKPVGDNLTKPVHCILDNLMTSNAASKKKDRETDSRSGKEVVDLCVTNKS